MNIYVYKIHRDLLMFFSLHNIFFMFLFIKTLYITLYININVTKYLL